MIEFSKRRSKKSKIFYYAQRKSIEIRFEHIGVVDLDISFSGGGKKDYVCTSFRVPGPHVYSVWAYNNKPWEEIISNAIRSQSWLIGEFKEFQNILKDAKSGKIKLDG